MAATGSSGRTTSTVLFTDLVGSTELRSRLGDETAEGLRRQHDRVVAEAITVNGGRVVKNLGDGVMATFTGAADGVAAAVAVQQAIDGQNRSSATVGPIDVRVGLSAGDVTFEEGDCFGTPVIEAARLCAAARGGQILVSEIVRWLVGSGSGHNFRAVGSLPLKGLPAPVPACEVAWEPLPAAGALPLPSLLAGTGRIFVGRDEDLQRLTQLWKEAAAGERRVALLAGEPGIGKTRLAAELALAAHAEGAVVLAGRCDEDLGVPYQPLVEALRHYAHHASEPRLGRHGGELARVVPELSQQIAGLAPPLRADPETERYRLFDAVAAWLGDVSVERPVLLVLDDLQWAAKPTLLLLRHVLHSAEALRLLVVVTYRDTDIGRRHPLSEFLADLRRDVGVERFPLTGLDLAGVGAYIEAAAGHTVPEGDDDFPRAVWEETEGNPFFVAEVLRHLAESGAIAQRDGQWVVTAAVEDLGIPEGVRDVIGRRLSRLAPETDRVLGVASVVGLEFEPGVVGLAGGFGEDELLSGLEEATAARLLAEAPGSRYRFSHALVRATLYEELSAARRVALHRRVAEAIETSHRGALDDHLPALAHHWARAAAPAAEAGRAVDYAKRAGDRALAQLAHDEAAAYYRQALELLEHSENAPDSSAAVELLIALGEAQRRAGDPAHRETLLEAAHRAQDRGDAEALARAALANTRGGMHSVAGEVDGERVAVLEGALQAVGVADSTLRARLLATLGQEIMWTGDRTRRVALSDEALAMARRLADPATLAEVLLARYYTTAAPSTRDERWASTAELLDLAERLGDGATRSRALALRYRVAMERADIDEADRCLEANERLAAEAHQPTLRWFVTMQRAGRTLLAGRLADGERLVFEAAEAGRAAGQPDADHYALWQLVLVRFEQGRLGELVESLADQAQRQPALPAFRAMLAVALWHAGRSEEAREALGALADGGFGVFPADSIWLRGITQCAVLCAELGDASRAEVLYQLLAPYADHLPTFSLGTASASVSHFLGRLATTLARLDEANGHFSDAAAIHARIGAPIWLARTRLEWARMLLAGGKPGDAERGRVLLGQALATARELGLAHVERRTLALLQ